MTRLALLLLLVFCVPFAAAQDEPRVLTLTTQSEEAKSHFQEGLRDQENIFFERSAKHFEKALEADPDFAMAEFMLAAVKPGLTNEERLEAMDDALAGLAGASAGEMLFALAWREDLRGDDEAAQALFDAAVALLPDDPHVALRRAQATEAIYTRGRCSP